MFFDVIKLSTRFINTLLLFRRKIIYSFCYGSVVQETKNVLELIFSNLSYKKMVVCRGLVDYSTVGPPTILPKEVSLLDSACNRLMTGHYVVSYCMKN